MYTDEWQLFAAGLGAGIILGLSKSGIKGIAMLTVAIMAITFSAKASTGILLPMLIGADILAVSYYRRHVQWLHLVKMLPWMMAGVLIGVWVGNEVPEALFKSGMSTIILISVIIMFWWDNNKKDLTSNAVIAPIMGLGAGFATMVGNLAGAFSNIYFLAMRLPKDQFIGTAAWLFFIINLFKLPFHIWVWGTITPSSLMISASLFPGVLLGFFGGVRLVKRIREKRFRQMILVLTAIGAIIILFK